MKRLLKYLKPRVSDNPKQFSQEELLEFVIDERNIEKAVEGSMKRRIELLDRVELRERHA